MVVTQPLRFQLRKLLRIPNIQFSQHKGVPLQHQRKHTLISIHLHAVQRHSQQILIDRQHSCQRLHLPSKPIRPAVGLSLLQRVFHSVPDRIPIKLDLHRVPHEISTRDKEPIDLIMIDHLIESTTMQKLLIQRMRKPPIHPDEVVRSETVMLIGLPHHVQFRHHHWIVHLQTELSHLHYLLPLVLFSMLLIVLYHFPYFGSVPILLNIAQLLLNEDCVRTITTLSCKLLQFSISEHYQVVLCL